jgi:hypothetical protein
VATINIVEATAKNRLDRAHKSKTRPAIELSGLKPKDEVEIWFEPSNKDLSGWRGPAELLSVNADEGNYSVRLQGRTLTRQASEVRPYVPYFTFMAYLHPEQFACWIVVKLFVESMAPGSQITLGVLFSSSRGS